MKLRNEIEHFFTTLKEEEHNFRLVLGPHHDAHEIPKTTYGANWKLDIYDIESVMSPDNYQLVVQDIFNGLEESGYGVERIKRIDGWDEWGTYNIYNIELKPQHQNVIDSFLDWVDKFQDATEEAFRNARGDDDTYDYTPSFVGCFIDLIYGIFPEDKANELSFRYMEVLYHIDPEYPEFFEDEMIERFKKSL